MIEPKDYITETVSDLLKSFLIKKRSKETTYFAGKVIDNNDPDREGKCKIRVYSVYKEIPDEDLPWALPENTFTGSTLGSFIVPAVGSVVRVYFEDDEFYQPKYTTKMQHTSKLKEFTSDIYEDYPDSMVFFETDNGDFYKINRAANVHTFKTATGVLIRIEEDGSVIVDTSSAETGDITLKSSNNIHIEAGKKVYLKGTTGIDMQFPGASLWYPNTLPSDSFTGKPQGSTGGVTGLTLSEPT